VAVWAAIAPSMHLGQRLAGLRLVDQRGRDVVGVLERASSSSARVDSASPGSQEEVSLFWTSVSFPAKGAATIMMTIQAAKDEPLGARAGEPAGELTGAWRSLHH
jgi:hypothetical protein